MTCPSCGSPGAYVGLAKVECDREGCEKYVAPPYDPTAGTTANPDAIPPAVSWDSIQALMREIQQYREPEMYQYAIKARWARPWAFSYPPVLDSAPPKPETAD